MANAIARSQTIFPGSWTVFGCRHADNATDKARSKPILVAVSTSTTVPARDTTPLPDASTANDGYNPIALLTRKVLLNSHEYGLK